MSDKYCEAGLKVGAHKFYKFYKFSQDFHVELTLHFFAHDGEGIKGAQRFFIGPARGQSIVDVRDLADSGEMRNFVPHQTLGVAVSPLLLVMLARHFYHMSCVALHAFQDLLPQRCMGFNCLEFFKSQFAVFIEDAGIDLGFSHIVEHAAKT